MNESTPNIQSRIVQYTMQNGTEVTQRRSYLVDGSNKWRQVKNMDAWTMIEDTIDSYADLMPTELTVNKLLPVVEPESHIEATEKIEVKTVEPAAKAIGTVAVGRKGFWNRAIESLNRPIVKKAIGAAAVALTVIGFAATTRYDSNDTPQAKTEIVSPDNGHVENISTTSEVAIETPVAPTLTTEQLQFIYGNIVSGDRANNTIGNISINPNDPEGSIEALYNDLRHNPDALAFWNACLNSGTPSYDVCVVTPSTLQSAREMALRLRTMDITQKATLAETVISQFEKAQFDGISIDNGVYKTVGIHADGSYFAMSNTRQNDPRLNFTFTGKDGNEYKVQLRNCVQLTEGETPSEPVAPPVEETPPTTTTTVPETTTTTVPETTTTTVPETTTTTEPEETTTTSTSTTSTSTTSTTEPTTTTVPVTVPKTNPTYPEQEVTTTVTAGEPTPIDPTTSTVPESTTQPTAPADTAVSTTAPEVAVDNPPVNQDTIFPFGFLLAGGGLATLSLPALERRKREKAALKKSK